MEFNSLREIGQYLKGQREQKNITLEEVAFSIKISNRILQALEEGDESRLPSKAYIRGFVQNYTKYLGLDVKEIMNEFQKIAGSARPQPIDGTISNATPETKTTTNLDASPTRDIRKIVTVALIVVLLVVIFILERSLKKYVSEQQNVTATTAGSLPLVLPTKEPSPIGSPLSAGAVDSTASATPTSSPTPTPTQTPTPSPTLTPKPKATPTPTPSPKPTPTPTPPKPTPSPAPIAKDEGGPQELIVEALDSVKMKVQIDSQPDKAMNLNVDQIQTIRAKHSVKISISNGGAVNIIYNGLDMGIPGTNGQPLNLNFPK